MTEPNFYDIATALGPVVAEALAQKDGLFVHRMLADDGESFHDDKFVVSAISCGYRATRGYWFASVEQPSATWTRLLPLPIGARSCPTRQFTLPCAPPFAEILRNHEPAGQDNEDAAIPDTAWIQGFATTQPQ